MINKPGIEYLLRKGFDKDKYMANTMSRHKVGLEEFAKRIAKRSGILSETNVLMTIEEIKKELIDILAEGQTIGLENFLFISSSITGNFDSLNSKFDPKKHKIRINISPSSNMTKQLNHSPKVFKVSKKEKIPELKKVYDLESGSYNSKLTVGGMVRLEGNRLFFNIKAEDEGIYIYSADKKRAIKVDYKDVVCNKELRFIVPPGIDVLGDKVIIEVKSRMKMKTKIIRSGVSDCVLIVLGPKQQK